MTTTSLGGVETLNLHLSKALAKIGYNVYLCTECKKISKQKNLINIPTSEIIHIIIIYSLIILLVQMSQKFLTNLSYQKKYFGCIILYH